jgi:hypothetical protein
MYKGALSLSFELNNLKATKPIEPTKTTKKKSIKK